MFFNKLYSERDMDIVNVFVKECNNKYISKRVPIIDEGFYDDGRYYKERINGFREKLLGDFKNFSPYVVKYKTIMVEDNCIESIIRKISYKLYPIEIQTLKELGLLRKINESHYIRFSNIKKSIMDSMSHLKGALSLTENVSMKGFLFIN